LSNKIKAITEQSQNRARKNNGSEAAAGGLLKTSMKKNEKSIGQNKEKLKKR